MKIFIGLKDLHAKLPDLTMLEFFLSVTLVTRFGTYPIIHMQSTNMVKVRTAIARMQTYCKAYDPNAFHFLKDGCRKCGSVNGHHFDNE